MTTYLKNFDGHISMMLQTSYYTRDGGSVDIGSLVVPLEDGVTHQPATISVDGSSRKKAYLPISRSVPADVFPVVTANVSSSDGKVGIQLKVNTKDSDTNSKLSTVSMLVFSDGVAVLSNSYHYPWDVPYVDDPLGQLSEKLVDDIYRGLFTINTTPPTDEVHLFAMAIEECSDELLQWMLLPFEHR